MREKPTKRGGRYGSGPKETSLAEAIRAGGPLRASATEAAGLSNWERIPALAQEEQRALFDALRHGRHAASSIRTRLVESYLRVVIEEARLFRGRGVALADLAQEGCLALIRAVDRFEPPRHAEFARYAVWLIRRRLRHVTRATLGLASLQQPDEPLGELEDDGSTVDPYASTFQAELEHTAHALLRTLDSEEEHVLRLRFGIGLTDPLSFEEIGRSLGMDPKRVSRLESRALSALKRRARRLKQAI